MPHQEICWFCGKTEAQCTHLVQSAARPVRFTMTANATEGQATGTLSVNGKAHANICDECVEISRAVIAEYEKGEAATNNHAQEHKE